MEKKVGFIGLGIMDRPMVRNLLKAGFDVTVFDIVEAAVKEMADKNFWKKDIRHLRRIQTMWNIG
ncbi:hypothetical protein TAMA11512_17630 [Selenomonas sp. TAMA-11512]|uniref:NAD(P)-binding domain-containing protein n=1 Tax=Selenomonas sp. TAMA-11512 TaxID=3095337 RepID=UPI0030867FAA|nr:hypothetical protein TAMA11512_17630 [Selenomonas sp. TAMA-11512]